MSKKIKIFLVICGLVIIGVVSFKSIKKINPNRKYEVGQKLDSLNSVYVYYNGGVDHIEERNLTEDGYNLGLNYQCVEFVKRYYFEHYKHKMPDSYGNAKDFYEDEIKDGAINKKRNLVQFSNPSGVKPQIGDLLIFDGHTGNPYGHVAIISAITDNEIEIIQQNPGPFASSRIKLGYGFHNSTYIIDHDRVLGWLRMK